MNTIRNEIEEEHKRDMRHPSYAIRYWWECFKLDLGGLCYRLARLFTRLQRYFDGV